MRDPNQLLPDHAAVLATLGRSVPAPPAAVPSGTVVRVTGTARPGPQGLLTAPLSGRPCVWFRVLEVRHPPLHGLQWLNGAGVASPGLPPVMSSDVGYPAAGDAAVRSDESSALITVDTPTGPVLVDPARGDVDAPVAHDSTEGAFRMTDYVLRREWVLEAGAPVFAVGVVHAGGAEPVLHATPGDCLVLSARGEQAVVDRARSTLQVAAAGRPQRGITTAVLVAAAVVVLVAVAVVVAVVA